MVILKTIWLEMTIYIDKPNGFDLNAWAKEICRTFPYHF